MARVFYGATDPAELRPEPTEDEWNTELDAVENLLREFAGHLLRRSAPYNAAKHGLAMTIGDAEFSLTPNTPDPARRSFLGAKGPSITCLEERTAGGRSRWSKATYWVDLDATLTLTFIATSLIAAAWDVGRAKYLGPPADGLRLRRFGHLDLSRIRENGVIADKFAMDLLYYGD